MSAKVSTTKNDIAGLRPTGINELDIMLGGGLPEKATVLLNGDAGVGKTTLVMQWLFEGFSKYHETGVYLTLTESTTTSIANVSKKKFFSDEYVASADVNASQVESQIASRPGIHFVDFRQILEEMNLLKTNYTYKDVDKIHEVIFKLAMNAEVKRLAIDSISAISYLLGDKSLVRAFIYKLGKFLALSDSNTVLVGEASKKGTGVFGVEEFISDGVIELKYAGQGMFSTRSLKIKKMRWVNFDPRPVTYQISDKGIDMFLLDNQILNHKASSKRIPTGIVGFDKMVSGGLIAESSILISGPSGGGKTIFSMQTIVESLKKGRRCLYISHEESRHQIIRNALEFGWDLKMFEEKGLLKIETPHPDQMHIDELVYSISKTINNFSPEVAVVDSLTAMANMYDDKKVHEWVSQLIMNFKKHKTMSIFLSATTNLVGESVASNSGTSSLFDQIILLRYVEMDSEFHHAILVVKMRGSSHDKKMYKLEFSPDGLLVAESFSGYEGVFSGSAKHISKSKEDRLHEIFLESLGPMGEIIFIEQKEDGLKQNGILSMIDNMYDEGILDKTKEEIFRDKVIDIYQGSKS